MREEFARRGFGELVVTGDHAWAVAELPPHHRDPFDRLLIAQAKLEKLVLVTADDRFRSYGVPIIW
jgi:PIN domain nuclease of toxin-antitoxin system